MPRPGLVEQANEDDAGDPFLVWTGEVIETDDMALRLDDDACFSSLVDGLAPEDDDDGEKQPGLEALSVLPDATGRTVSSTHGSGHPVNQHPSSWPRVHGPDMRRFSCGSLDVTVAGRMSQALAG